MSKILQLQRSLDNVREYCPGLPEGRIEFKPGHGFYIAAGDRSLFLGNYKKALDFFYECVQTGRVNHAALRSGSVAPVKATPPEHHPMRDIVEGLQAKLRRAIVEYKEAEKKTLENPQHPYFYADESFYSGHVYGIKGALFLVELSSEFPTVTEMNLGEGKIEVISWDEYHRRRKADVANYPIQPTRQPLESAS